ncbi:MAG: hypothetical protein K2M61_03500 [Muribaculaceae bacterium]|nr:hypothetical protein [Muribaculaceae bacterium]
MNTKKHIITTTDNNEFPIDSWVRFSIGDREYIGRALCLERALVVATIDTAGQSVTFSWPFICSNLTSPLEVIK